MPHRFLENLKSISPLAWRLGTVVVVVMVAIAVALIGGWSSEGDSGDGHRARVVEPSPEKPSKIAEKPDTTVTTPPSMADIAKLIDPSVVTIVVEGRGQGSGFVVDANGTIVTNYHVIEGAKKATVIFRDGTKADVLGFSAFSAGKDLTVIHVAPAGRTLRPLELADEQPNKGTTVLAFGSPRGLTSSVSDGIVSAVRLGSELRQMLTTDLYVNLGFDFDATWIQTTAPISHGNSGGPLVDQAGKVVGVNTWSPGGQNLNFAISAAHVKRLMAQRSNRIRPLSELPEPRKAKEAEVASDGSFKGHSDEVLSVAFSPDGLKVLSGSVDETMRLWDTATGKEIRRFKALSGQVSSVAFSPNGLKVLSGSGEGTMWLWDTATGKEICSFEGHSGQVLSVAFSPDGLKVLSGGWDRTMRLWDTATGREIRGFKGHSGKVSSVAFSPNGLKVLLGSADGTLRLWNSMLSMKE